MFLFLLGIYVVCILIHTVAKMDHALTPYFIIAAVWNGKGIMTTVPAWCVSAHASFVFKIDSQKTQCLLIALNKMQLLKKIILYVEVIF